MVITGIFEIMSDNFKQCVKEKALLARIMTTLMISTVSTTASNKKSQIN
jgi:hypothetical protein